MRMVNEDNVTGNGAENDDATTVYEVLFWVAWMSSRASAMVIRCSVSWSRSQPLVSWGEGRWP